MSRIKRRLGGERYQKVSALFEEAFRMQKERGDLEAYKIWIDYLLVEYYDPMYDYQIAKNKDRIVFRGSEQEIEDFLKKENAKK
jgi:tRNA 2-selenouridine synthase